MAARKPLFQTTEGFHEEMATSDSMTLGGLTMGGNIAMGTYKITGMGDGSDPTDAVTKQQLDAVAAGVTWQPPVKVLNMIDDSDMSGAPPVGPVKGDAYVVNNWGVGYNNGDIVEYSGTAWVVIVANSGSEPPNGTRVLVSGTSATTPAGSFTGQDEKYAVYNATTDTWAFTAPVDGYASLVTGDGSVYENQGYTYDGANWIQFTGLGEVIAGDGLGKTDNTIFVQPGDGIAIGTGGNADRVIANLTSNGGLQFSGTTPNKTLGVYADGNNGIVVGANGVALELDDTPDTLDVDADGLKVVGLPSLFKVNDVAVGATVTAPNLDTLTSGSDADALHYHKKAPKVGNLIAVSEAVAKADPVYWSSTNDRVGKGRADNDAKSRIMGVAETAQGTPGNTASIVSHGTITGAIPGTGVAGTPYYLQDTGGIGTAPPMAGKRFIMVGWAENANDLWVHIIDYGKKAGA